MSVFINNQYQGINVAMITLRLVAVSSFHFWITNKYVILVINDQNFDGGSLMILILLESLGCALNFK